MAVNTIETKQIFQTELDKQMEEELTSSWMDANAGQVIYTGGREVKIPKMNMDGLKEYSRADGYPSGGVSLEYETMTMKMDRGEGFTLDSMDVDESNFVATAGNVLGEFQRLKVVPEVDAYRYSTIYKTASANAKAVNLTEKTICGAIIDDVAAVQDAVGENTPLIVIINGLARALLNKSTEFTKQVSVADFKVGEIITKVKTINECPILQVPSARMYTAYDFWKGTEEDHETGGFTKTADSVLMNYIIMPRKAAIAVCKQDKPKIIDPDTNQKADAWFIGYRKYHDLWIKENMLSAIRISTSTAAGA